MHRACSTPVALRFLGWLGVTSLIFLVAGSAAAQSSIPTPPPASTPSWSAALTRGQFPDIACQSPPSTPDSGSVASFAVDPTDPQQLYAEYSRCVTGGLVSSADGGHTWQWVARVPFGGPAHLVAGPGVLYDVDDLYGVGRSTDGGATWTWADPAVQNPGYGLAIDPGDSARLYVPSRSFLRGGAVLNRSDDGGADWDTVPLPDYAALCAQAACPSPTGSPTTPVPMCTGDGVATVPGQLGLVYLGLGCGLLQSTDGGDTWTRLFDQSVGGVAVDPLNLVNIVVLAATGMPWVSSDAGATWTPLRAGAPEFTYITLQARSAGPAGIVGAATSYGPHTGWVWWSGDWGNSWVDLGYPPGQAYSYGNDTGPTRLGQIGVVGDRIFAATGTGLWWTDVPSP